MKKINKVSFMLHNEETLVATVDESGKNNARVAFEQFMAEKTAEIVTADGTIYYVPFHAVIWVKPEYEEVKAEAVVDANCNKKDCDC